MKEQSSNAAAKLIVALDLPTGEEARKMANLITPAVNFFKIGSSLFCAQGPSIIKTLKDTGASIFLDLKLHDIPEQVRRTAKVIGAFGADMVSVHCLGGQAMLEAAKEGLSVGAEGAGLKCPLVVGVTVLTSLDDSDLVDVGIKNKVESQVKILAGQAVSAGLDGVVASAREIEIIKKEYHSKLLVVTPGIRPAQADVEDQKRVLTPAQAVSAGADYLVVGRPITDALDPYRAAAAIMVEVGGLSG